MIFVNDLNYASKGEGYKLKVLKSLKKLGIITLRNRKMVFLPIRNGKQVIDNYKHFLSAFNIIYKTT